MSSPRLYVDQPLAAHATLRVDGNAARHAGQVLRCRPGDELLLFDGSGREYPAVVARASRRELEVTTGEGRIAATESPLAVRLLQGISRGDRMDTVVQKATELGVARITPLLTAFSVVRLDDERAAKRRAHWQRVAIAACEQCGRNRLPDIDPPCALPELLAAPPPAGTRRLLLAPGAAGRIDGSAPAAVELLVGPEGGFDADEQRAATAAGFEAVGMGPRVLRTETAALVALALVQAAWGDLAG